MYHAKQKHAFILILTIFSFILVPDFPSTAHAADVTLCWDKPDNSSVTGYNIYCGRNETDFKSAPLKTIHSADQTTCTIFGLEEGQIYCFAATSIDSDGNESDFSDTFYYTVPKTNVESNNDDDGIERNYNAKDTENTNNSGTGGSDGGCFAATIRK